VILSFAMMRLNLRVVKPNNARSSRLNLFGNGFRSIAALSTATLAM